MADDRPEATQSAPSAASEPAPAGEPIHIAEELDDIEKESKARTFIVVGAVLLVIAVIVVAFSILMRPKPKASGTIDEAYAVALPGDNVLATIKVTINNVGGKPLWIRDLKAELVTADGKKFSDVAANAVDFDRYFRGYPDLRDHSIQPLKVETKIDPGEQVRGSIIAAFPVTLDMFNARQSLSAIVIPYAGAMAPGTTNEEPVIITTKAK